MDSDASRLSSRPSSPEAQELLHPTAKRTSNFSGTVSSTQSDFPTGLSADLRHKEGGALCMQMLTKKDRSLLTESELQTLRLKINSRERKRMHDLNVAMDGLREVMPYAHGPSVRKLSKIATLLLARNYMLMLSSSLEEMKRLVSEFYGGGHHSGFQSSPCGGMTQTGSLAAHSAVSHPVHAPLLSPAVSSAASLSGMTALRPHRGLMKTSCNAGPLGGSFQHWGTGMPCPCSVCQPSSSISNGVSLSGLGRNSK